MFLRLENSDARQWRRVRLIRKSDSGETVEESRTVRKSQTVEERLTGKDSYIV